MKKLFRMVVFSALAIYLTSLWNKGFILPNTLSMFIKATLAITIIYYLVLPISKLVLLPLNIITLGMMSFLVYLFALHLLNSGFNFITIKDWVFAGASFLGLTVPKTSINYLFNLVLSSFSISFVINFLEQIL